MWDFLGKQDITLLKEVAMKLGYRADNKKDALIKTITELGQDDVPHKEQKSKTKTKKEPEPCCAEKPVRN